MFVLKNVYAALDTARRRIFVEHTRATRTLPPGAFSMRSYCHVVLILKREMCSVRKLPPSSPRSHSRAPLPVRCAAYFRETFSHGRHSKPPWEVLPTGHRIISGRRVAKRMSAKRQRSKPPSDSQCPTDRPIDRSIDRSNRVDPGAHLRENAALIRRSAEIGR